MIEFTTSRERVSRALTFQKPDRVQRELWALPGVRMLRQAELGIVLEDYPSDFIDPEHRYGVGEKESGIRAAVGTYFDEWGCPFEIGEPGVNGELKEPFSCFVQIRRVVPGGSIAVNREPPEV